MNQVYSTREMAQMCGVNESTIKRWADSGKLRCMKTPGGHRKFKIKDVLTFFNEYGFEALGVHGEGTSEPETGNIFPLLALKHDLPGLARHYVDSAISLETREAGQILGNLLATGYTLAEICDGVIAPALEEVGERWSEGHTGVIEEHLVTSTTLHALHRMSEMIPHQAGNGRSALCCPVDQEGHFIGVEMTRLSLEALGWTARALLSPAPIPEVSAYVRREEPDLVCVSIVNTAGNGYLHEELQELRKAAHESGALLALGGRGLPEEVDLPHDFVGRSVAELEHFARQIAGRKRGPEGKTNGGSP